MAIRLHVVEVTNVVLLALVSGHRYLFIHTSILAEVTVIRD